MAKSLAILIWIYSCITSPIIARQRVTLDVTLTNQHYEITFGNREFVKFHECLCGSDYALCSMELENVSNRSGDVHVRYLKVRDPLRVARVVGTKLRTFRCSLRMIELTWTIECGQYGSEPHSCPSSSNQCFTLKNRGNKNCSYQYLYAIWHSSQKLTFQDQSKFSAELTHCQCDSPRHTPTTVSAGTSAMMSTPTPSVKEISQDRENNSDDETFILIGVGSVALVVVVVVVIVVILVKRRKGGRPTRRGNSATVGSPDGYEHYSVIQDFSYVSLGASSDVSTDSRAQPQSINQGSSSLSQNRPAGEEVSQYSLAQLHESSDSIVYSEASRSSRPATVSTGNKTYAKLHEMRRGKVNVYDVLPETS